MRISTSCSMKRNKDSNTKKMVIIAVTALLLTVMVAVNMMYGSATISFREIIKALSEKDSADFAYRIIVYLRLPRIVAAIAAGAALAVAGGVLQSVLNNALASPNIIGVNAGSGLFVVLITAFFPTHLTMIPFAAFAGALIVALLIYFTAYKTGASRITIVLAGLAVGSFFGAAIDAVLTLKPDVMISVNSFMVGGFSAVNFDVVRFALFYIVIGLILAMVLSREMNVISLGDEVAASLGVRVHLFRFVLIVCASLLAGSAVSFAGLLGFIGLIVPHMCRSMIGHDNRFVLPFSALAGALFVLTCDLIARTAFAPYELPVGIIMSAIGGPFFIYLLFKQRRGRLYD
jgi:iron complex transport system permease protein